jgi:6-phospho-beta-glucosidase
MSRAHTSLFLLGGSTFYTLLLVDSLRRQGVLGGLRRITLAGRNEARLAAVAHLSRALCGEAPVIIDTALDPAQSLDPEYGVVFHQIRYGGMSARDLDEKLAIKHGLVADETLGAVGITNALRALHGATPLLELLQRKARPYTLINFTNPCSVVTQHMAGSFGLPVVGICDYPEILRGAYARLLGAPRADVELGYFGVNHFGFIHDVRLRGESVLGEVKARLDECALAPAYHRAFELIPIPACDLIFDRRAVWDRQRSEANRAAYLVRLEQELEARMAQTPLAQLTPRPFLDRLAGRGCDWYDLIVSPVLANVLGLARERLVLNLDAAAIAPGGVAPAGCAPCVLETAAAPDADGQHRALPLERALAGSLELGLVAQMKRAELELLAAWREGSVERLERACLWNPMIQDHRALRGYLCDAAAADPGLVEIMPALARIAPLGARVAAGAGSITGAAVAAAAAAAPAGHSHDARPRGAFDLAAFQAQGFAHVPALVAGTALAALQHELRALIADRSLMVPRQGAEHFFQKYQSTSYCYADRHAHVPTLAALIDGPELRAIVTALLGEEGVFHGSLVQYHGAAEGQAIPWHQDIDPEEVGPGKMFNFLLYPYDLDLESGALYVVPGSHGVGRLPWGEPHGALPGQVPICARAGDLVVTDCTLFHKVNHNHSPRDRMSVNLRFRHRALGPQQTSVGIYRNGRVNYAG